MWRVLGRVVTGVDLSVLWLLLDKYQSWRFAPQVTAHTLIIAADHDEVVPSARTERLLSHFRKELASMIVLAETRPQYDF
jgi:alpha-beta hydrolase superfamily lysophospholipase